MKLAKKKNTLQADIQTEGTTKNIKKKKRHLALKIFLVVVALFVVAGGAFAANVYINLNKVVSTKKTITADGLKGEIDLSALKGEGDGRVNILLLGTGDDGHAGENLTDTMIVASLDPKTNDVVMIGIPRDLYVRVPGYGWNKINAAHALAEQNKPGSGPELIKQTISEIINQPIHYFTRVDFTGHKVAVDKIGGINVYN